jgi:prophage regulatory protein
MTRLLKRPDVERMVCLSRSTIYQLVSEGRFPRPIKIGDKAVAWRLSDIEDWIASREAA